MAYEVWETQTGNLVASFSREQDALRLVRDAASMHGESYVRSLALVCEDEAGHTRTVAMADQLLARARAAA